MEKFAIGIDLGCTHIKALLLKEDGSIVKEVRVDTNEHDDQHWKNEVAKIIKDFKQQSHTKIKAIGLSKTGLIDRTRSPLPLTNLAALLGSVASTSPFTNLPLLSLAL